LGSLPPTEPEEILRFADEVAKLLEDHGIRSVLIGAAAMAVYGYVRSTLDVDLGTAVDPTPALTRIADLLKTRGHEVEYRHPDPEDPLGGVVRVRLGDDAGLDIVNFLNPYRAGAESVLNDALDKAKPAEKGSALRVIPLAHLIALKLYAAGPTSRADAAELLRRHPELDRAELRAFLEKHGLADALDQIPSSEM
jgi:hypothetical protein